MNYFYRYKKWSYKEEEEEEGLKWREEGTPQTSSHPSPIHRYVKDNTKRGYK